MKNLMLSFSLVLIPGIANAQDQSSTPKEQPTVVFLREAGSNRDIRAELVKLDSSSVIIQVAGKRRELPLAQVSRLQVPVKDSIRNGALIGALIVGVWCATVCAQGANGSDPVWAVVAVNTGIGALVGAAIDAVNYDLKPIYPTPLVSRVRFSSSSPKLLFSFRFRF